MGMDGIGINVRPRTGLYFLPNLVYNGCVILKICEFQCHQRPICAHFGKVFLGDDIKQKLFVCSCSILQSLME